MLLSLDLFSVRPCVTIDGVGADTPFRHLMEGTGVFVSVR